VLRRQPKASLSATKGTRKLFDIVAHRLSATAFNLFLVLSENNNGFHTMSEGHVQLKRRRRVRRTKCAKRSADITSAPSDPFYVALLDIANSTDGNFIRQLLRDLQARGFDIGTVDDFLIAFDWDAALRLLPFLMEYAESLRNADGAEKEKQTLALLLRIAQLAGVEDKFDENAVTTLRIVIEKLTEVSKGQYKINLGRLGRLIAAVAAWSMRHCSCRSGGAGDAVSG